MIRSSTHWSKKAAKQATNYGRFPYGVLPRSPRLKTVEADPPGGLRYRHPHEQDRHRHG